MTESPALPADLRLVRLETADSARAEAVRRARADAEEGTLIWVEHPEDPRARLDREWLLATEPGLHASLVLRPELPVKECVQLGPVAAVTLGRTFGSIAMPMAELHYRWPNDVLLDGGKVAGIWLDAGGSRERVEWLVLSWAINTRESPQSLAFEAASLVREGAAGDPVDHGELLQAISRHLVASIATWDESGFAPILRSWRGRIPLGNEIDFTLADGVAVHGRALEIDDEGALVVETEGGTENIALERFFLDPTMEDS